MQFTQISFIEWTKIIRPEKTSDLNRRASTFHYVFVLNTFSLQCSCFMQLQKKIIWHNSKLLKCSEKKFKIRVSYLK